MINLNNQIGQKVINKINQVGTIKSVDKNYIRVEYDDGVKPYQSDAFERGFLSFEDQDLQKEIDQEILDKKNQLAANKIRIREAAIRGVVTSEFGKDYNAKYLDLSTKLNYREVINRFGITIIKGIGSKSDAVYLISSVKKEKDGYVYHDHWTDDGDFVYSGEGGSGDQKLTAGNKAIAEAKQNGKKIVLIIRLSSEEYYVQGEFELVQYEPVNAKGADGLKRTEYQFTLRKIKQNG